MFEIDENNLPFVRTRQALLLIDLQNDFVSAGGILPVDQPPDFLDRTLRLVPEFRASGNIIWIRSVFEESRPVNEALGDCESVITDNELERTNRGGDARLKARLKPSKRVMEKIEKTFEEDRIPLESDDAIEAGEEEEEGEVMENEETFLTLRPKQLPLAVISTSPGANFAQAAVEELDVEKDLVFQKSWYSAFKDGTLVQILRAKFVTEIYLCGALTNISVFATAMDAARHGYAITIVGDCLGYRSKARHDEALRRLVEFAGCNITSSEKLIEHLQRTGRHQTPPKRYQVQRPQAKTKGTSSTGIESLMASLNLRPDGSSAPAHKAVSTGPQDDVAASEAGDNSESHSTQATESLELTLLKTTDDGKKRERVKSKIKTRSRHSKSAQKEVGEGSSKDNRINHTPQVSATLLAATQALENLPNSLLSKSEKAVDAAHSTKPIRADLDIARPEHSDIDTTPSVMAPSPKGGVTTSTAPIAYCEGDTTVVYNLLEKDIADGIFEKLRDGVSWQRMSHQGGQVPRLVAVQGAVGDDGSIPIYRHPADESPPLLPFSPTVDLIRKQAEKKLGHALNHVLIQFYRDSTDQITEHSDKTLDIARNTFICNVSLGAQRTMTFRTKRALKGSAEAIAEAGQPRQVQRVPLPHNSMAKVGLVTNMRWLHAIRPDKRMNSEKSPEELAFDCGRISLTFRLIETFLSQDQKKIWGQGAVAKSKDKARAVINGDAAESERMIRAFSKENFSSEFDWEGVYGQGFDVLHISNWPKLILSGDLVADLRVKSMLAEYNITSVESNPSETFHWKDGPPSKESAPVSRSSIKFIDNDSDQSTVVGDMAIMLYLDSIYGSKLPKESVSKSDLAKQFTRLQQADELLKKWQITPFNLESFREEMEIWDKFATEGQYIAGPNISIADFALWPILEEIRKEWKNIEGLDNIVDYYNRMRDRESVVKVLGSRTEKTNDGKV